MIKYTNKLEIKEMAVRMKTYSKALAIPVLTIITSANINLMQTK